ncbi:MAG: MFS transporter [Anaerolineae bacterium]|nr:MFS transporter [Anaerolineae bacterium]
MNRALLSWGYGRTFYLGFLSCLLFFSSMHLLITPLPLYIESIGGGPADVGLAGATFAIVALIVRPYLGRLVDTRGRKIALLIGAAIFAIGPLLYLAAGSLAVFQVARMFHGIGIAAFTSAYYALIADVTPPSRWGEALGLAGSAPFLSMIIASPLGTSLLEHTSFDLVFVLAAVLGLASLVAVLPIREPTRQTVTRGPQNPGPTSLRDLVRLREVMAPSLVTLALGIGYGAIISFLPLFARDRELGNVGFFFAIMSILSIVSRALAGGLSDRFGRLPVILPMLGVAAFSLLGLNWTYAFATLLLMGALQGIGFGGARVALETMVVDNAPTEVRGTALSLLYFCLDLGIAVSGLAIGAVAALWGYGEGYLIVGAVCALTLLLFAVVMRRPRTA